MTGRELIIYILSNNLENEELFKDGSIVGFNTIPQTAAKLKVGEETVKVWISRGMLESITIGGTVFVKDDIKNKE